MKNTGRIIRNFILLAIPLIAMSVYSFLCPMYYMAVEYSMWEEEKEYVNKKGLHNNDNEALELLILGDSRAKSGMLPEKLCEKAYNAAIGGTTPIEMYYAYKDYISKHDVPKKTMIIFAPYHFCDIDNWEQSLYYNYLSIPRQAEVYTNALKLGEEKVAYKGALSNMLSYKLRLPNKYLSAEYNAGFVKRYQDNYDKKTSVIADRGYTEFGTDNGNDGLNYETHHEVFDSSELVLMYFDKLLALLNESGTEVMIVQSPVNEASMEAISGEFLAGYREMLLDKTKAYDFTVETEIYPYDNKYFGDNNHLNRLGAEKFSEEIRNRYFE